MPTPRIALFLKADRNDYQELLREDCHAAAQRFHLSVRSLQGQDNAGRQLMQIEECLREPEGVRPVAMLVFPVGDAGLQRLATEAAQRGIAWVTLNRASDFLPELRRQFPKLALFSVTPDQRTIGRIQGKQVRALLPRGGQVVCIQGPSGNSSAEMRFVGLREELVGTSVALSTFVGDWSFVGGADEATRWLTRPSQRTLGECVLAAQNDSMAMGARTVIRRASITRPELANVQFLGCDGTPSYGQRLVQQEQLAATVVIPSTSGPAVEHVAAVLRGGRPPVRDLSPEATAFPETSRLSGSRRGRAVRA